MAMPKSVVSDGGAVLQGKMADMGAAGSLYIPCPMGGYIKTVHIARTESSAATSEITITTSTGVLGTTITPAAGGAVGDVDSWEFGPFEANNYCETATTLEFASDGAGTASKSAYFVICLEVPV